jgi:hypothetical protein
VRGCVWGVHCPIRSRQAFNIHATTPFVTVTVDTYHVPVFTGRTQSRSVSGTRVCLATFGSRGCVVSGVFHLRRGRGVGPRPLAITMARTSVRRCADFQIVCPWSDCATKPPTPHGHVCPTEPPICPIVASLVLHGLGRWGRLGEDPVPPRSQEICGLLAEKGPASWLSAVERQCVESSRSIIARCPSDSLTPSPRCIALLQAQVCRVI